VAFEYIVLGQDDEHERLYSDLSFSMSIFRILVNKLTDTTPYSSPTPRTAPTPISPIFPNSGTSTIENFTRTIRGYVPSISSGSSPTVSRPASFIGNLPSTATFRPPSRDHRRVVSQQEFERDYELHDDGENQYYFDGCHHLASQHIPSVPCAPAREGRSTLGGGASGLAQAMQRSGNAQPTSDQAEAISWARWDILHDRYIFALL